MILPVVLCGGSGTRLWPLSRKSLPKQFVPLIEGKSLLELTCERLSPISDEITCVTAEEYRFNVMELLAKQQLKGKIVLEPQAKNTAAAMAMAALDLSKRHDGADLLLFCPSDHHIPDKKKFHRIVDSGVSAATNGSIVVFGVLPTFPSTGYGYIKYTEREDVRHVTKFIEKPKQDIAQELILNGDALWNAGIFLVRIDVLLAALKTYAPDILAACQEAIVLAQEEVPVEAEQQIQFLRPNAEAFAKCRSESIDYAVMEKCDDIVVVPFDGQWSDIGSWNAVAEYAPRDDDGNGVFGDGLAIDAQNTYIHATHRVVVALGTRNTIIVETPDAVLVLDKSEVERVKNVVAELEARKSPIATSHRKIYRPWGSYDNIDSGARFLVKHICVKPGGTLSLQMHYHRAEHWIIVKGTAEVQRGEERFLLTENQSTFISIGEVHRLTNVGRTELEMIEVQSGSYLDEGDIVRLQDSYGRI